MSHCGICGRELIDWREADEDDPRMDCGGDCLGCMREFEDSMERDLPPLTWRELIRQPRLAITLLRFGIRLRDVVVRF